MDFLCTLKLKPRYIDPANWTDDTNQILGEHWNYLVSCQGQGKIKFVARTNYDVSHDANRGYAVYCAATEEEARKLMENDPCILNGIMEGELHPLLLFMLGDKILK